MSGQVKWVGRLLLGFLGAGRKVAGVERSGIGTSVSEGDRDMDGRNNWSAELLDRILGSRRGGVDEVVSLHLYVELLLTTK